MNKYQKFKEVYVITLPTSSSATLTSVCDNTTHLIICHIDEHQWQKTEEKAAEDGEHKTSQSNVVTSLQELMCHIGFGSKRTVDTRLV
jgi:hypothetical protein